MLQEFVLSKKSKSIYQVSQNNPTMFWHSFNNHYRNFEAETFATVLYCYTVLAHEC